MSTYIKMRIASRAEMMAALNHVEPELLRRQLARSAPA